MVQFDHFGSAAQSDLVACNLGFVGFYGILQRDANSSLHRTAGDGYRLCLIPILYDVGEQIVENPL